MAALAAEPEYHAYVQATLAMWQRKSQEEIELSWNVAPLRPKIEMPKGIAWFGPFGGKRIESHAHGPYDKIAKTVDLLATIREIARSG